MFTPINKITEIHCSSNESTIIHGSMTNSGGFGSFSGRTSKIESKTCRNNSSEKFLLFKNKDLLKNGVFWEYDISNQIYPVLPLYFSEESGINLPDELSLSGYYKSE